MATRFAAVWFLYSEEKEPWGQIYRAQDEAVPAVGTVIIDGVAWKRAEVVRFDELRSTCAMRRFRVIIRVVG